MKIVAAATLVSSLMLIAGCEKVSAGGATDRSALIAERVAFKNRTASFDIEKFECPARTVSDQTVETSLLLWVNDRADLTTQDDLKAASDDFVNAFVSCGASEAQITNELSRSDDIMMKGLVMAVLKQGRGLK